MATDAANQPPIPDKPMLNVPEVAGLLGVSTATVRRLAQSGELDMQKIGGMWFMNRPAALKLLGEPWQGPGEWG